MRVARSGRLDSVISGSGLLGQPRQSAADLLYPGLQLGVGVLPELDEFPVVLGGLLPVALGLVQLAQPLEARGEGQGRDIDPVQGGRRDELLIGSARGIGLPRLVVRSGQLIEPAKATTARFVVKLAVRCNRIA